MKSFLLVHCHVTPINYFVSHHPKRSLVFRLVCYHYEMIQYDILHQVIHIYAHFNILNGEAH